MRDFQFMNAVIGIDVDSDHLHEIEEKYDKKSCYGIHVCFYHPNFNHAKFCRRKKIGDDGIPGHLPRKKFFYCPGKIFGESDVFMFSSRRNRCLLSCD